MAARAAHGDGSCRQVKTGRHDGKWRVQYVLKDLSGVKKRLSRLFDTQREGKEFLRELQRAEEQAAMAAARELTFGEWFHWLAENDWPETIDEKTLRDRLSRYRKYAADRWDKVPLTKIDPLDVHAFYRKLRDDGVGDHTRIALKTHLVRAFNQALTPYRRVPHFYGNPFALPMPSPKLRVAVALTPEQARSALRHKNLDPSRRAMLGVFLLAGLRLGEQMALTRGQLDFEHGLIRVDRAVKLSATSSQSVGLPKSGKVRMAVMCDTLRKLLEEVCEGMADDQVIWSAATVNQPRMKKLVYATWRTIVKDAGLPSDMSPHDCRLTHINWIEKLCPEVSSTTLKEHVGHAADGVTEVNYTRPLSASQGVLRLGLDQLLSSSRISRSQF